jgi:hypothetical protein
MGGLNSVGSSIPLKRLLFPSGFAAEVMILIQETWQAFIRNQDVRLEEPITAVFRDALIRAYVAAGRRWFVTLEDPITDPTYGTELGRNDIRFYPPEHYGQSIYFVVECKRLHVMTESGFKYLTDKYVTEGLQRFVDGQYCAGLPCGGMVGYVMDDRIDDAFARVQREIQDRLLQLKMKTADFHVPSSVLNSCNHSADSLHTRTDGEIIVHHLLVTTSRRQ